MTACSMRLQQAHQADSDKQQNHETSSVDMEISYSTVVFKLIIEGSY